MVSGTRDAAPRCEGTYFGGTDGFTVELRVDLHGPRGRAVVSGDLFGGAGDPAGEVESRYVQSFRATDALVHDEGTVYAIEGAGTAARGTAADRTPIDGEPIEVRVRVDRYGTWCEADLSFGRGRSSLVFRLTAHRPTFRELRYEVLQIPEQSLLPRLAIDSGYPFQNPTIVKRTLTLESAWAEAGVGVVPIAGGPTLIPRTSIPKQDLGHHWTIGELHEVMRRHSRLWKPRAQWTCCLFLVQHIERDKLGTMFDRDHEGPMRLGCVVAQKKIEAGSQPEHVGPVKMRAYLHEMGHGLNLDHSDRKRGPGNQLASRWGSASYMTEAERFDPSGAGLPPCPDENDCGGGDEAAYWRRFGFSFDELELAHLRHAYLPDIMPGWHPWIQGVDSVS